VDVEILRLRLEAPQPQDDTLYCRRTRELANHREECGEAGKEYATLEGHGDAVEAAEFGEERTAGRCGLDGTHLNAKGGHLGAHGVLGDDSQENHQEDAKGGRRREAGKGTGAEQAGDEQDDAAGHTEKVKPPERVANDGAGLVATGQDAEGAGCYDKAEEGIAAEPEA